MTDRLRAAAEAALERLEHLEFNKPHVRGTDDCHEDIIEEIRAALAEPDAKPYKRSERASPVLVESEALRLCTHKNDSPQSFILGWRAAEAYHEVGGVA